MIKTLAVTNKHLSYQTSKSFSFSKNQRKAETRTKIQLGGLLIKSGIASKFAIHIGSDLQLDPDQQEKATILLGALIEMNQNLSSYPSKKEEWAILGRVAFVDHFLSGKKKMGVVKEESQHKIKKA